MTPDDQLDTVLRHLDNDLPHRETFTHIIENIGFDISDKDLELLVDKLVSDGYVQASPQTSGGQPNGKYVYNITFQGRFFSSRGGYNAQTKTIIWNNRFKIAKTIANVANATILIIIAVVGIWVTYDEKQKDDDIKSLTVQLDKQAATIDSLRHTLTATKDTISKTPKP